MGSQKQKIYYSIIRYMADEIRGEILNVGALLYCFEEKSIKWSMLEENSNKLRAILETKSDIMKYKTSKEVMEYYLNNSSKNMLGDVGEVNIASYYEEDFLDKIYEKYSDGNLILSKPNFGYTKNINLFYESILKRYVGEKNILKEANTISAKKYMRNLFSNTNLLGTKVKSDYILTPIEELKDLKIKIDFTFKNNIWNYMQTIPKVNTSTKNTEWFAKIQLMLDSLKDTDAKIHLLYKLSEIQDDEETSNLIKYLKYHNDKIITLDIEKENEVVKLCDYINNEAETLDKLAI